MKTRRATSRTTKNTKNKSKPTGNFDRYIKLVLGQVHPDLKISENVKSQINFFLNLLALKLIEEAKTLASGNIYVGKGLNKNSKNIQRKTINAREIQLAVRNIIPNELGKHAISEGTKALTRRLSADGSSVNVSKMSRIAGILFPIARVENIIRDNYKGRIGSGTAVYLAAVLEYISAEILELTGNATVDNKEKTLKSRYLMLAINNDEELKKLAQTIDWDILGGGVIPNIHSEILKSIPSLRRRHALKYKSRVSNRTSRSSKKIRSRSRTRRSRTRISRRSRTRRSRTRRLRKRIIEKR